MADGKGGKKKSGKKTSIFHCLVCNRKWRGNEMIPGVFLSELKKIKSPQIWEKIRTKMRVEII